MSHTPNINAGHGGARTRPSVIDEIHDQWCRENGYSGTPQASSTKPQAPATPGLDRSSHPRYNRSQGQASDGPAIDICEGPAMGPRNSAAEILQVEQHKYPGDRSSRNCRIMVPNPGTNPSLKPQAKLQAPRPTKPQAASRKHNPKPQALASRTLEKVSETSDRGL